MFEARSQILPAANFTLQPLVPLAGCFALGITAGKFFGGWQIYLFVCLIAATAAIVFLKKSFGIIFLFVAFTAVGGLYFTTANQPLVANRLKKLFDERRIKSGDPIEIEGVLTSEPEPAAGGFFLEIKTEKAIYKNSEMSVAGSVRLFAATAERADFADEYERLNLHSGAKIRAACRLRREDRYLNAGVASQMEILDAAEIDATANLKSPLLVEKIADRDGFSPLAPVYEWRNNLIVP